MEKPTIEQLSKALEYLGLNVHDCQFNLGGGNVQNIIIGSLPDGFGKQQEVKCELPEELKSEKAQKILKNLQEYDYLDENNQPNNLSLSAQSLIAYQIGARLNIKCVWKVFSKFWGQNPETMRAAYNKAMEQQKTSQLLDKLNPLINI